MSESQPDTRLNLSAFTCPAEQIGCTQGALMVAIRAFQQARPMWRIFDFISPVLSQ